MDLALPRTLVLLTLPACVHISDEEFEARLALGREADTDTAADTDTGTDTDTQPADCDADGDGDASPECGGTDCDDGDPAVSGTTGYSVPSDAYPTIADAMTAVSAAGSGTICVTRDQTGPVVFPATGGIRLLGLGPERTTIDASGSGSRVVTMSGADRSALEGFTLSGGQASQGAGLYASNGSVTLKHLLIQGNTCVEAQCSGVGLYLVSGANVEDVEVTGNEVRLPAQQVAVTGAAVHVQQVTGTVSDLRVHSNTVTGTGLATGSFVNGTVAVLDSMLDVRWLEISGNEVDVSPSGSAVFVATGGAMLVDGIGSQFSDVTITENRITSNGSGGSVKGAALAVLDGQQRFTRLRIAGNTIQAQEVAGAALYTFGAPEVRMQNVQVLGNTATAMDAKGTLYLSDRTYTELTNADIVGNRLEAGTGGSVSGGGLYIDSSQGTLLTSVSLADNALEGATTAGHAIFGGSNGALPTFAYCNLYGHESPAVLWQGAETTPTSTSVWDPAYTDISSADPLAWNVRPSSGSPLIDAGNPDAAYNDADGSRNDIGSYGGPSGAW